MPLEDRDGGPASAPAPRRRTKPPAQRPLEVVGWREHVGLPDLGVARMPAKIDTGARTSALHAEEQQVFERDGRSWVAFVFPDPTTRRPRAFEAPVLEWRDIKNTGGVPERRIVIRTTLLLGRHRWRIDVSLADRRRMEFDLILGRTAARKRRILVDPGHSWLLDRADRPRLIAESGRRRTKETGGGDD